MGAKTAVFLRVAASLFLSGFKKRPHRGDPSERGPSERVLEHDR
jgi:hypothetical protein